MGKYFHNSHVFYRRMGNQHPTITHGDGIYLYDNKGNRYIDASGGALVVNAGHNNQEIIQAIINQTKKVAYIHPTMFTSEVLEEYCSSLAEIVPINDPKFYLTTSGSEAVETAIKLARQIQIERGESSRHLIISRNMSYHGLTFGALAVTGKEKMRSPFKPLFKDMPHIPPPYCFRCPFGLTYPSCDLLCATNLEDKINEFGPENICAFLAETISGAALGGVIPPLEYWKTIEKICNKYGILIIADEVLTGMGRTGKWFALEHWNPQADIITIGKGAASGYFPLSIVAVRNELVDLIREGSGDFNHGGTFSHHAVGAAAGLATLNFIKSNSLVSYVASIGNDFGKMLIANFSDHPNVGNIRGTGFLWGIEFVADRSTNKPLEASMHMAQKFADTAMDLGLIVYPGSGSVDGISGDHFLLAPPFTTSMTQLEEIVSLLNIIFQKVLPK